jgi:NTE family protein
LSPALGVGGGRQPYHDELLSRLLQEDFGDVEPEALERLQRAMTWTELASGQVLMRQGEAGDALYLLVSGRLRATVRDETAPGGQRLVGEISRGQIVGELALITGDPRNATVNAVRDSLLARLDRSAFNALLASHAALAMALSRQLVLTRQMVRRLKADDGQGLYPRPGTIALVPVTPGVDVRGLAEALAAELAPFGRVEVVDAARVHGDVDAPEATLGPLSMMDEKRRIALLLDRIESRAEFMLLVADDEPTAWTARCCRGADELLLLADATQAPAVHATERLCLGDRTAVAEASDAAEILLLLHPADTWAPRGTRAWLDRRAVQGHLHLRQGHRGDLRRLARFLNRSAVGLVLAGGGARGLAHLGVVRALREQGEEIDFVGGTSIGAVMATYVASDRRWDDVMLNARRAFDARPTGDYSLWPWLSVFRGRRLRRVIADGVHGLLGHEADAEDLWKGFFCIATNYSQAREQVLQRGPLARLLLASTSIPGALPPVLIGGELHCDGGSFNNFPVDVMRRQRGVGRVIGVDLDIRQPLRVDLDEVPGGWALFVDWLRPVRKRRYRLPSLPAYLMTVMVLNSMARGRQARALADLCFHPPLERVGLLQWKRFDRIVQIGYEHALQMLAQEGRRATDLS